MKHNIYTDQAPAPIGSYSQAIRCGDTVYIAGQIPLPVGADMLLEGDFIQQTRQVFANIDAICQAAGGSLQQIVKLTVYLTELSNAKLVNEVMSDLFKAPYPARAAVEVSALPLGAPIEIESIMVAV